MCHVAWQSQGKHRKSGQYRAENKTHPNMSQLLRFEQFASPKGKLTWWAAHVRQHDVSWLEKEGQPGNPPQTQTHRKVFQQAEHGSDTTRVGGCLASSVQGINCTTQRGFTPHGNTSHPTAWHIAYPTTTGSHPTSKSHWHTTSKMRVGNCLVRRVRAYVFSH